MPRPEQEHPILVQEIVDVLLGKFEHLPVLDRNLVIIASVEAVAWLCAMESEAHKKKKGLSDQEVQGRFDKYSELFVATGAKEMSHTPTKSSDT